MTRPAIEPAPTVLSEDPVRSHPRQAQLRRVRRWLRRRTRWGSRWARRSSRQWTAAAWHAWRSSLQLRIGSITMVVAGIVVVVVSVVLFDQIKNQLLEVKQQAAIDQAQAGVVYAQSQVSGIVTGDAASVRSTLDRTVRELQSRNGEAGNFDTVLVYRAGGAPRTAASGPFLYSSMPPELVERVDEGAQVRKYALVRNSAQLQVPALLIGAPVPIDATGGEQVDLFYVFPLDQEQESLTLVRSTVIISGIALTLFVVGIGVLVTRLVVDPVRRAARGAQRLAEGDLEERLAVSGEDDLARLASSFNAMADSLQQQIVQLESLSHLQQRFTSDVSHELRTPLTTVQMAAEVLHESRGDFDPHVARSAELLYAEVNRFELLLSDLLEISRYDSGAAELEAEPTDLGQLVHRVADGMATLAERHDCRLEVRTPPRAVIAEVDARRVQRVLRNLLGNAIEHGAGKPVELTLAANRTAAAITVRDHGIGLSATDAQQVFDRFWRADPARVRTVGGSGLGLSISQEDARLHGGWLQVWGQPDQGAQFRLTMPLTAGAELTGSPLPLRPAVVRRPGGPL